MRIGPEHWLWVSIDSPGVPRCGRVGDPWGFAALGRRLGFKLAWSLQHGAFACYTEPSPGVLQPEHTFYDFVADRALPVYPAHVALFESLRGLHADKPVAQALRELRAKQEYEEMTRRAQQSEDMRPDAIQMAGLKLGWRTPRAAIQVPRLAWPTGGRQ